MSRSLPLTIFLAASAVAAAAFAAEGGAIRKLTLGSVERAASPTLEGVSSGFVVGAFDQAGLYAASSEMAQGAVFPPHSHPDQRMTVVVSGTMHLGEGSDFDPDALVAYPAGTVAITPAGTEHFMAAPDGDVELLEIGAGPSETRFVETD